MKKDTPKKTTEAGEDVKKGGSKKKVVKAGADESERLVNGIGLHKPCGLSNV